MTIINRCPKLNKDEKDFVLKQHARNHSPSLIVSELQSEFGKTITYQAVQGYRKRNPELIIEKRKIFLVSMDGIPLFEKAERITELQHFFDSFKKKCAGNFGAEEIGVLKGIIEQVRKELEGIKDSERSDITNIIFGFGLMEGLREIDTDDLRILIKVLRNGNREKKSSSIFSRNKASSEYKG